MANVFDNNPSIFMQWRCGSEKWASLFAMILIIKPSPIENYCFNIFLNV